jgi:ribosomal protein S18 acetylase RimI-like enzyme
MADRTPSRPAIAGITYRRAAIEDAERTFEVVREAAEDVLRRAGRLSRDGPALPLPRVIRFRHFCVRHDGERFWVAEADGRMVGAVIAILRGRVWYLAALHVVPAFQSRGIGTELLRRSMAGVGPDTALIVLTDALNPASNGLYFRFHMLPQETMLTFDGPLDGASGRQPPGAISGASFDVHPLDPSRDRATLDRFDRGSVGFSRPVDHDFWAGVPGLEGYLLEDEGTVRGYLYLSDEGAVGPAAVRAPESVPGVLATGARLARERGAANLHVRIAGSARPGISWLVGEGFRLTGIGLMLSTRSVGRLDRYLTSGADALY